MAYQFHSWSRGGIAAKITTPDDLGAGTAPTNSREEISFDIDISGQLVHKQFLVASAADITGIRQEIIVRTDPRPNSGDFEPNYFASIEFYDHDFAWRYTPAAPVGENRSQLRPWLMLVVLTEDEFHKSIQRSSLSSIVVTKPGALPPHRELHLWAHVHSNLGNPTTPLEHVLGNLHDQFETDPDGLYSRIICPRKLDPNVLYHAFLVPVFESGRRSGLDLTIQNIPAQQPAWTDLIEEIELPVYYRWQFRTGDNSDFETLLRLMEARNDLDPRVGVMDLDCSKPGFVVIGSEDEVPPTSPPVLGMGGAVKQLGAVPIGFEEPPAEQVFVQEVKKHLDLQIQEENFESDPVVTIPFYGMHHAKTTEQLPAFQPESDCWLHDLNRDPRNRSAAGLGTKVVQDHQEELMQSAWAQLPQIQEVNRRIKHTQLVFQVNLGLLQTNFEEMKNFPGKVLAMAGNSISRITDPEESKTIFQIISQSQVPNATFSSSMRRLSRPRGKIAKRLKSSGSLSLNKIFIKLNPRVPAAPINVDASDWFATSNDISVNKNIPRALPQLRAFIPNTKADNNQIINEKTTHLRKVLNQTNAVMSIEVKEEISTVKIPDNYETKVLHALHPAQTLLPALRATTDGLPKPPENEEELLPIMAHPDFPEPTYQYLAQINPDFIIPNLELIPPNTVALMEPNFEFIHSFFVGLNHEMARELLWRQYPTDLRGTCFRQFWDPGGLRSPQENNGTSTDYKDIKPIPQWGSDTVLSDFAQIGRPLPNKPLVLLLRGDLLKKYPNTIVFAQRAVRINNELLLADNSQPENLKFPLFSGSLPPDVRLLGFDLSVSEVKGENLLSVNPAETEPGWFFVMAEVPGEPRFGMDIDYTAPKNGAKNTWDNLSRGNFITPDVFTKGSIPPAAGVLGWPNDGTEANVNQVLEKWARSSADMAGILLQKPTMLAVHGSELLGAFQS